MKTWRGIIAGLVVFSLPVAQLPAQEKTGITEISVEREDGAKDGPRDVVTFRSDKSAQYVGKSNVERLGEFTGRLPEHYFHAPFESLTEVYEGLRKDGVSTGKPNSNVTVITIRVVRDGKQEEIRDLCPGLDRRLFAFEMAVRGVAADITWKQKPK